MQAIAYYLGVFVVCGSDGDGVGGGEGGDNSNSSQQFNFTVMLT